MRIPPGRLATPSFGPRCSPREPPSPGRGVNPTLLGTVTRTDVPFGGPVQQVTYAGLPLYRFFLDEVPGEREGANLFDPVTSPTGIWYLVDPSKGLPARGQPQMRLETAPLGGTGPDETVLAVSMNDSFSLFADGSFPVYTLSTDRGHTSACEGQCALSWPPVLTSGRPEAGPNIDRHALGTIVRPDGSHQVTFNGQPLYLYVGDAYIPGIPGISGPAASTAPGCTARGECSTPSRHRPSHRTPSNRPDHVHQQKASETSVQLPEQTHPANAATRQQPDPIRKEDSDGTKEREDLAAGPRRPSGGRGPSGRS